MAKLRIYKAISAYTDYIKSFYAKNPNLCSASFDQQIRCFEEDAFQWQIAWKCFNRDNNVTIFETIHNAFFLQNAWANGRYSLTDNWQLPIIYEQIKVFQPDICVLYSPDFFTSEVVNEIKQIVPHVFICGYDGMNRKKISLYDEYHCVLTCSPYISSYYSEHNMLTYAFNFGINNGSIQKIQNTPLKYFMGFSGSIFPKIHTDRLNLLRIVQHNVPLTLSSQFAYLPTGFLRRRFIHQLSDISIKDIPLYFHMHRNNVGPMYGIDMFRFLKECRISLNMHGNNINFAANFRLFEATGIGSCLLTDWKENIEDLFEPGKEILVYHSPEEAADIAKFCYSHPDYCDAIAKKGQMRTLANYSFTEIIPNIIEFLKFQV